MKVLIVGGYGVFGGRLARLLLSDGIELVVAGRSGRNAAAFTQRHGGFPLEFDLQRDLSPILKVRPDVVIDAAGPFHAYGGDTYRLARFCIEHGVHYLDLSDDAGFTEGIASLDCAARASGCVVLSGVSSVPAMSAAAVSLLREGLSDIQLISSAILPGNRNLLRGRSVIASILSQAGRPLKVWRGGVWRDALAWTDSRQIPVSHGKPRIASPIGAPDLTLFPSAFQARSVLFHAGLELRVMHWALIWLARLRWLIGDLEWLAVPLSRLSRVFAPFGSDRGIMIVTLIGQRSGEPVRRCWQVTAECGQGPLLPAVPARAIIRKLASVSPGARPCLHELTMSDIEDAMTDLSVKTSVTEAPAPTLFRRVLKERWDHLPETVQRLHSVQDLESFSGTARVTRGRGVLARLAAWFFRFPFAGDAVPLTMTKLRTEKGEVWERNFGGRIFRSHLTASARPFHYYERFGPFTYEQELPVRDRSLYFPVRRGWFLGIPLPSILLPISESREYDADGRFCFDVGLGAPLGGGLIVRYQGTVVPDCDRPPVPVEVATAEHEKRTARESRPV